MAARFSHIAFSEYSHFKLESSLSPSNYYLNKFLQSSQPLKVPKMSYYVWCINVCKFWHVSISALSNLWLNGDIFMIKKPNFLRYRIRINRDILLAFFRYPRMSHKNNHANIVAQNSDPVKWPKLLHSK